MKLPYQSAFTRYLPLAILIVVIAVSCRAFSQTEQSKVLPDKPQLKTSSMRNFWIAAGVDTVATFADAYATNGAQNRGCIETNAIYGGDHPSAGRVYGTMFGIMAAEQTVSYLLRRHNHHKFWLAPILTNSGLHLEGAIHSATCR